MDISRYELKRDLNNYYTLIIYLDPLLTEFSTELGETRLKKDDLNKHIRSLIKERFPHVPIKAAKVMAGSLIITTLYLTGSATSAGAEANSSTQLTQGNQFDVYTVQSGDSLSLIAKRFNVSTASIKSLNHLASDSIFIGQKLNLPFFTYTVVSGDSLSVIAKRFNTSTAAIGTFNQLTSNTINIGQKLKIPTSTNPIEETPVDHPTVEDNNGTYTVVSGDSLSLIAKKYSTTVDTIRTLNLLTTDIIYVGQILKVPQNQQPDTTEEAPPTVKDPEIELTPETPKTDALTTYTVVSGDSLSLIAKKFSTTVAAIQSQNNLSTTVIYIGQMLTIPKTAVENETPTEPIKEITTTYTVIAGDSLSVIAKRLNTTVDAIKSTNSLTTDIIFIGQTLKIPTAQTVPVKPADNLAPSIPVLTTANQITSSNHARLNISGATETNANVKVSISDGKNEPNNFEVKADANGKFQQVVDVSMLQDGNITITASATDAAGNQSSGSKLIVKKDTVSTAPTISSTTINKSSSGTYPILGTADPGSIVTIVISDGENLEITTQSVTNERGEFRAIVDLTRLNDGEIFITANAKDSLENESQASKITVIKDSSINQPTMELPPSINSDSVGTVAIRGKSEENASVMIKATDGVSEVEASVTSTKEGDYKANLDLTSLNDGKITITATAIDRFGNKSEKNTGIIAKDTFASEPMIDNKKHVTNVNAHEYTIFGVAERDATVKITVTDENNSKINTSVTANDNGEFQANVDLRSLSDGQLTITAQGIDLSGNHSGTLVNKLLKDTDIPLVPIFNNNFFINNENQSSYLLTGSAEGNAQINVIISNNDGQSIQVSGTADETGSYRIPIDLTTFNDGDVTFKITQNDFAGNISPSISKTLIKDTTAPTNLEVDQLNTIFSGNANSYKVAGSAEPNITLEITLSDEKTNVIKSLTTNQDGSFEIPFDVSTLMDGNITVSFLTRDAAGNSGTPEPITIKKDTTAPTKAILTVPPFVNSQNMKQYDITGSSVEEGSLIKMVVTDGTTAITKSTKVINGSFNTQLDLSSLKNGPISFEITQIDLAGNTGIVQATSLEKDTTVENPIISKNGFKYENLQSIYTMIGLAEPNATIEITIFDANGNELLTKSSSADSKGYYSTFMHLDLDVLNTSGEITASVSQTDLAGNTSELTSVGLYTYKVAASDSLVSIAKRYNTTVEALMSLNQLTSEAIQTNQQLRLPISASEVINLGYMYFGNTNEYINMINQTANSVNIVSPSYFDINSDGSLKLTYQVDPHFISMMHQQGKRVVPFLSNHWDRTIGRAMLENKEQAAQQIADAIEHYNLDGVNVDIENVTEIDRENYTEFVRLLREKIPVSKEVSVAVAANPNGWSSGWHGSYDYTELAKYADYLMIMSYDESYTGGEAGSVASYSWVEKSIQYALDQGVTSDKIVVGVAHFGRYWIEGVSYGGFGISNSKVEEMIQKYNGSVTFDEISKTPKATITINEGDPITFVSGSSLSPDTYTIWYENEESIRHKLSLVNQYNLRGVGNWSIGQENPEVWNSYTTSLPTIVPVTSPEFTNVDKDEGKDYKLYTVVSGDSLWSIANKNNTTVTILRDINNLNTDTVLIGQTLKIPSGENNITVTEPETSTMSYTVVSGDSLSVIAKRYNTTVTSIKEQNNLISDSIYVGQVLNISTTTTSTENVTPPKDPEITTYTVVSGDSLSVIANRFNTTVTLIKETNNLTTDTIYVGQTLKITH
ncbi:LysM peptidoglycan-binding domain-containing protein [Metabacillus elymi]|uniref:LysM peptidoglycan-binding domain-containing protein n=1 Tax=Metabacillus elymi TaxID=2745198 RepID=A0ABX6S7B2_9BACI|nr:LysM peptidoglycan-binding domain-containing protein [Metabacillus sp. KUDC1714]QNF29662.1 LysM peptidoglycan-binding domain-containing protein [Metabacillus sp. KUDC1714]